MSETTLLNAEICLWAAANLLSVRRALLPVVACGLAPQDFAKEFPPFQAGNASAAPRHEVR